MNLHDAISMYRLQLEANGRSEHTLAQAERHLNRFREWLGDAPGAERDVETIDATLIARFFVSDAAKLGVGGAMKKPTSMNAMRSSLRAFFRFLHDAGHVRQDPTRLVRRARCSPPPPRAITPGDEAKLLAAIDADTSEAAKRDAALVRLLARTGLRISSALAIRVEDLDNEALEIAIREAKGDREDRIPVSAATIATLRGLVGRRCEGPVFVGARGEAIGRRHVARRVAMWAERAGIARRVHPHAFRHGLAIRMLDSSGDLRLVQQALRHRSIASTTRYAEVAGSKVRAALAELERAG